MEQYFDTEWEYHTAIEEPFIFFVQTFAGQTHQPLCGIDVRLVFHNNVSNNGRQANFLCFW